jgi:hypothetical protein
MKIVCKSFGQCLSRDVIHHAQVHCSTTNYKTTGVERKKPAEPVPCLSFFCTPFLRRNPILDKDGTSERYINHRVHVSQPADALPLPKPKHRSTLVCSTYRPSIMSDIVSSECCCYCIGIDHSSDSLVGL